MKDEPEGKQPALFGVDMFGDPIQAKVTSMLSKKFIVPPFSVLDARQGYWQERKSAWINLGIQSELGRGETNNPGSAGDLRGDTGNGWVHFEGESKDAIRGDKRLTWVSDDTSRKILTGGRGIRSNGQVRTREQDGAWMSPRTPSVYGTEGNIKEASGTSIFDPVLCELAYTWFCPSGGLVLDPFAGGSVRGIVASLLGFKYWGCELASGQVAANLAQAGVICPSNIPIWVSGDSTIELPNAPMSDLVFTCPPYGGLERYSDDPRDLSTMEYPDFINALKHIFELSVGKLKQNRFACVVIGDYRDERGKYHGFVADTVKMFRELGLTLYNDAVLVTAVGSLPLRVQNQFADGRKLGKTHQNVLVFLKGRVPIMDAPANIQ